MFDMTRHMRDAIRVNRRRAPLYAKLCDGLSYPHSGALIRSEIFSLPVTLWFDLRGNRYQKRGIPIIAEEFLDMVDAGDFAPHFPDDLDYRRPLRPVNCDSVIRAIGQANHSGDATRIISLCEEQLSDLSDQLHVYRMTRHLFESVRRGAAMIGWHVQRADGLGIAPPLKLSRDLIDLQLRSLPKAKAFDERAAEVQVRGVPFLFYDLPSIGIEPRTAVYTNTASRP